MEESISLEETNKIRISLGLKPLTDDSAPSDDKEKQAEDNYAKQRERQVKERETKYLHGSFLSMRLVLIDASLFQTNIRPDSQVSFNSLYWLFGLSQWLLLIFAITGWETDENSMPPSRVQHLVIPTVIQKIPWSGSRKPRSVTRSWRRKGSRSLRTWTGLFRVTNIQKVRVAPAIWKWLAW